MQFQSPLGPVAWAILAGIPVGIIALYFLKLRRRPVMVSSTMLWRRSLEDLHVNSLFQRLRRNLLLVLQLLAVLIAMLALAGPRVRGTTSQGQRYILAIDNSASMSATDIRPSRFVEALRKAAEVIDGMNSDDLAMIIAFSDRAEVVSSYSGNKNLLSQRLRSIRPTQGTTSLRDALEVAAGLANPSSDLAARSLPQGVVATTAMIPPKLLIYTDGGFPDVEGFSVGNLVPEVIVIGPAPPPISNEAAASQDRRGAEHPSDNVAILALQCSRNTEFPDQVQVFGRIHNYRGEDVSTVARLFGLDPLNPDAEPRLLDAIDLKVPAQADRSFELNLPDPGEIQVEVHLDVEDALPLDNRAFAVFGAPRRARVLLVSEGNRYLADTLQTPGTSALADVELIARSDLESADIQRDLRAGRFDLAIFDNAAPADPPEANTLYLGALPPGHEQGETREIEWPVILDWDVSHPLMNYIRDLGLVRIAKSRVFEVSPGGTALMETQGGPIAFTLPRGGFIDTIVGFSLLDGDSFNTDWMVHRSFPIFLYNALQFLGNARDAGSEEVHAPGRPVALRADPTVERILVRPPEGRSTPVDRNPQGMFVYNEARTTGIYRASWENEGSQAFAVNLFDARESNLATRGMVPAGVRENDAEKYKIKIGYTAVEGTRRSIASVQDWWKPLAVCVLGILLIEWFVYNRRVYI